MDSSMGRAAGFVTLVTSITVACFASVRGSAGEANHATQQRRAYLRYLTDVRRQLHRTASKQREAQLWLHPEPSELRSAVSRRGQLWERTADHSDFVQVRVGTGSQALATALESSSIPAGADAVCADGLASLIHEYGTVTELPMAVSLKAFHHIHVYGTDEQGIRNLVRSMVGQAVTLHGPDDLRLMIYGPAQQSHEWEWIDYLPHVQRLPDHQPPSLVTAFADDAASFTRLVAAVSNRSPFNRNGSQRLPHVLIVCDTLPLPDELDWLLTEGRQGVTLVRLVPNTRAGVDIGLEMTVTDDELTLETPNGAYTGRPDSLTIGQAIRLARDLSRFSLAESASSSSSRGGHDG
ncbi:hypothetical protein OG949_41150 (plasmid) [Streptomyces scopuliridis]|uniref:hypothetical protein n=1 Tax=Streptomyces scopuliridis TaxID=452529 RepID=UPI002DD89CDB|nr:hypothetical protein [Streptomyces scopuliridis]WSB39150.1 hypothetical protein OG949_41150 [Streptomyces scopuliridis]